ncbi:MAG: A/G-specific adenine glycosylase [Ruminococcaceae bacterium]|nr:A/G-specific adenine glycosylase [Oscillospiraceae bacterium]
MKQKLSETIAALSEWYRKCAKPLPWRLDPSPYHVWISEIMLQQTRIEAVIPYYERFLAELPDVSSLAEVDDERLMKLWQGLGYYSRARNLKRAAMRIMEHHGGALPADFAALRALPGIGDYTAGAIASIAFGLPEPAVDGNVMRVLTRILADDTDIAKPAAKQKFIAPLREVYPSGDAARLASEALMELGEQICIPNGAPKCERCPAAQLCEAHRLGLESELPVKSAKAARRVEICTILLLTQNGRYAIRRRPDKGLLAGLWEFPSLPGAADEDAIAEFLTRENLTHVGNVHALGNAKHIFTHVEWHMTGLSVEVSGEPESLIFASPEELREVYAIPTAFRAYTSQIL